jgi:hypothetical protein
MTREQVQMFITKTPTHYRDLNPRSLVSWSGPLDQPSIYFYKQNVKQLCLFKQMPKHGEHQLVTIKKVLHLIWTQLIYGVKTTKLGFRVVTPKVAPSAD